MKHPHVRSLAIAGVLALSPLAGAMPAAATPLSVAQDDVTTTTQIEVESGVDHSIIPTPKASGTYEVNAGDPGSSEQYLVFVLIIGGLAAITFLVSRESKKKRAALGLSAPDPAALYEDDTNS